MGKVKFGLDLLQELLDSKIVKKFSDFEKMTPEDLAAAQMKRERQLLEAEANKKKALVTSDEVNKDVDIFDDDISQVDVTSPTVQVSLDFEKGKDSVLDTINKVKYVSGENFSKALDKNTNNLQEIFGQVFNDIDSGKPLDYKFFRENFLDSYDDELAAYKKSTLKFDQERFDNHMAFVEENYKTAFEQFKSLPPAVQKELLVTGKNPFSYEDMAQNYSTMPISQKLAIFAGDLDIPIRHPGNDFFQSRYESSIASNINQEREYL